MGYERPDLPAITRPGGPYLRNCWYVAMWAAELGEPPLARFYLGEPVALFRDSAGVAHAIEGRCPHRFAALGHGRVVGDALECPYHGLRFDGSGACVFHPQAGAKVPDRQVRSYPLVERHALLWIWMGDADKADADLIPDFGWLDDGHWDVVRGSTRAEGHYELYSDNILDLTHVNFVHPMLSAPVFTSGEYRFWQDETHAFSDYVGLNEHLSQGLAPVLGTSGRVQDFYGFVQWHAPAVLLFDYRWGEPGTPREQCRSMPSLHAFTPESADTTHYIWATGRDIARGDAEYSAQLHAALEYAFEHEDMPVIRDCHRQMMGGEFWGFKPLILEGDGGGVRARRILKRMIEREQAG